MNSIIIEPSITTQHPTLAHDISVWAREARLDVLVHTDPMLLASIHEAYQQNASTVIACGGFDFLDRVISEMCREFVLHGKTPPIFGHIPPLRLPSAISSRLPAAYLKRHFSQSLQQIAARKIISKPAFHCGQDIWFTHSLKLEVHKSNSQPCKFFIHTPRGSKIVVQTPVKTIEVITVEMPDNNDHQAYLTISAARNNVINTYGESLLEDNSNKSAQFLKPRPSRVQSSEKAFQALADRLSIHAPEELYSEHFDRIIPARCKIESAEFFIQTIIAKNTVGKY